MRLLLDTHALIWWAQDSPQLGRRARTMIDGGEAEVLVSAASAYEMFNKKRLGKLAGVDVLLTDLAGYLAQQLFSELPITVRHAEIAGSLPIPHRDPFDRLLIAQAIADDLELVSNERRFGAWGVRRLW